MKDENKDKSKEGFCAPCLAAIPFAFAGGGAVANEANEQNKKFKLSPGEITGYVFLSIFLSVFLFYAGKYAYIKVFGCTSNCK